MKNITSHEELNKLIAQSLRWQEGVYYESQSEPMTDIEIRFYHPPHIDECNPESWFHEHGATPDFCSDWCCIEEFLLPECDYANALTEIHRSPQNITCVIWNTYMMQFGSFQTGAGTDYPRSMPLSFCLAWLRFKGVEFEINIAYKEAIA